MKNIAKKLMITLLSFFIVFQAKTQNSKIDSLDILIKKEVNDTARINLILLKLDILSAINLDSANSLALETLKETQKIKYYSGEKALREKLVYNYSYKGNFKAASEELDYLEKIIRPGKDSTDFANFYASKGLLFGMQSKYDSSINFYEKAIRIFEKTGDSNRLSVCYSNIAIGYQQQSNLSGALFYQQKSLKLYELNKNEIGQAYTIVNMANTYQQMGDFERSESAFLRSIEIAIKNGLSNVELYAYTNLSNLYMDQSNWQKSYEYSIKAVDLGGKMGDQGIQAASLSKASTAMVYLNQTDTAFTLAKEAIALAESSGQPLNISQAYSSMGLVLKSEKKWKEAIPFYEKGFESIKETDLYTLNNGRLYKELSECYEKSGDYFKSLEMFRQYATITDSVRNRENIKKATELMMSYEFEKKEETARALQAAKDEIAYTRQVTLIIGLVLSLILIIGAVIAYLSKQKANHKLQGQKKELESTLTKLKNTQAQLIQQEKLASLGQLTAGIAHEIKNPLNFVNNFSEVSVEMIEEIIDARLKTQDSRPKTEAEEIEDEILEDIKGNLKKIHEHGSRANGIVTSMLQHSRGGSGKMEPTDLNALIKEYVNLSFHGMRAGKNPIDVEIALDLDKEIKEIPLVREDFTRVIINLCNNAFDACAERSRSTMRSKQDLTGFNPASAGLSGLEPYHPKLTVSTKAVKSPSGDSRLPDGQVGVEISVEDNGPGIPDDIKDKILQPFFTTKKGTEGTGLGLSITHDIVKAHGGELEIETSINIGTKFIIKLPIV